MALRYERQEPVGEQLRRGGEELRGVRDDVSELFGDLRLLAQKEIELARAEVSEQVGLTRNTALFGGLAALLAFVTLIFAFTTLMLALDETMSLALASLVTTGIALALTAIMGFLLYTTIKKLSIVPKRTMESISEDLQWAKSRMRFSAK